MNVACPELLFGLVGAIGTDLAQVEDDLSNALSSVRYRPVPIKLSDLMRELSAPWSKLPERNDPSYYDKAMNAGNNLRKRLNDAGAMANLAIASIRRRRDKACGEDPIKVAYILNSLKREEEIDRLREVYGPAVFIIAAYSPRESRVGRLAMKLAEQQHDNQSQRYRANAERLIARDENEKLEFGQGVRKAYPRADLFVDTTSRVKITASIDRFVELLFGNFWKTPSRDEEGMALAHLASLRSASPARQVGAAIADELGRVVSIGVNEVPKAGGGQYWEGDFGDGRDFVYADHDMSDSMRLNLLADVLDRLRKLGRLAPDCPLNSELLNLRSKDYQQLRDAQLFDTIDFIRSVHAEGTALFAAGAAARGATLYVTTFPCHECARHIVISGIKRVVYIEPYPKSLVAELFRDSILVDAEEDSDHRISFLPFSGIAPSVYSNLFRPSQNRKRKGKDGRITKWVPQASFPHLSVTYSETATRVAETALIQSFNKQLLLRGILNGQNRRAVGKRVASHRNAGRRTRGR
jgi:deoxycytidylate deaminase